MNEISDQNDADDAAIAGQNGGPIAFLVKIFLLSSLIALIAWWFVLS